MSRTSVLAIFAAAGIAFSGVVTADAMALARAITSGESAQLERFARQYPQSQYKADALRLADNCTTNWVNGDCGTDSDRKGINNGNAGGGNPGCAGGNAT